MEGGADSWLLLGFSRCGGSEGEKEIVCETDGRGRRSGFFLAEEKWSAAWKKSSSRGGGCCCLGRDRFRYRFKVVFFFLLFFFQNCPPFLSVLKAAIYRQNVACASKLVPQLLLFLYKF